jgi:predicted enzyme related to lactoylglutathione lyase
MAEAFARMFGGEWVEAYSAGWRPLGRDGGEITTSTCIPQRQQRSAMSVSFEKTIPLLRIFSVDRAKEFYLDYLGISVDWEHHFEENTPAYLQFSRAGLVLHLTEHHGDCCPGSTVFVWMTGIDEFHREITNKGYKYLRPGIETTFYDAKCVEVIDPFGNRIRFNEDLKGAKAT